jgi:Tfp pilus assembly protein PilO
MADTEVQLIGRFNGEDYRLGSVWFDPEKDGVGSVELTFAELLRQVATSFELAGIIDDVYDEGNSDG